MWCETETVNPAATPPATKDESAFLACILVNKAFSPLIPGTRSSRGNDKAIRRHEACSCPSVWASGTSYSGAKQLPSAVWQQRKEPHPAERSPDSCSCIYLSTNGAILLKKVCLWFYHLHIWWGSKQRLLFSGYNTSGQAHNHLSVKAILQQCNFHPQITESTPNRERWSGDKSFSKRREIYRKVLVKKGSGW